MAAPKKKIIEQATPQGRKREWVEPLLASVDEKSTASCSRGAKSGVRQNIGGILDRANKYAFIENGVSPYGIKSYKNSAGHSCISPRDAIELCQMAYYNIPIFQNTINLMTEFTCAPIFFSGGNELSRKFFEAWAKKINLWSFQDQFFREYYRGGNVFVYKLMASFTRQDLGKLSKIFEYEVAATEIPGKYIILNAADIEIQSCFWTELAEYYKIINEYELRSILSGGAVSDELLDKIPELKEIKKGAKTGTLIKIKLTKDRLSTIFYKKQDYELCSIPFGFAVLDDINKKEEMKNIDMAINRQLQQAVLLITMGNETDGAPSPQNMDAMRQIFSNPSVARVLVAAWDTEANFVIPTIGDILDPQKYEILDRDIRLGLNNMLFGEGEKYSNTDIKVEVFLARLQHSREQFLKEFLIPEMEKIGKQLNFKKIPVPAFEDSDFKDDSVRSKIYSHLIEIGALTPEEGLVAIKTGRLPTPEESLESQKKFKKYRDDELYIPVMNSGAAAGELGGNPGGKNAKPNGGAGKKPSVPGGKAKASDETFDIIKVQKVMSGIDKLTASIESKLKEKFGLRGNKKLTQAQLDIATQLTEVIISNEKLIDWETKTQEYINNPMKQNNEVYNEVQKIMSSYEFPIYSKRAAAILFQSNLI